MKTRQEAPKQFLVTKSQLKKYVAELIKQGYTGSYLDKVMRG